MKRRPGRLWMLFYGRPRRGFPGLLVAVLATVFVLALVFAVPGGADASRIVAGVVFGLLVLAALVFAAVAALRPRR